MQGAGGMRVGEVCSKRGIGMQGLLGVAVVTKASGESRIWVEGAASLRSNDSGTLGTNLGLVPRSRAENTSRGVSAMGNAVIPGKTIEASTSCLLPKQLQ